MLQALPRTLRLLPALAGVASFGVACGFEDGELGAGDTLLVPADVEVDSWDAAYDALDDGLGAVIPVDVMVYDGATGEPRDGVEVDLVASGDAHLLTTDELSRVDPGACGDCSLFWDSWQDQYYALDVDLPAGPARVRTDAEGIARLYVVVDAMGSGDGAYSPVTVRVETLDADGSFSIRAL